MDQTAELDRILVDGLEGLDETAFAGMEVADSEAIVETAVLEQSLGFVA